MNGKSNLLMVDPSRKLSRRQEMDRLIAKPTKEWNSDDLASHEMLIFLGGRLCSQLDKLERACSAAKD